MLIRTTLAPVVAEGLRCAFKWYYTLPGTGWLSTASRWSGGGACWSPFSQADLATGQLPWDDVFRVLDDTAKPPAEQLPVTGASSMYPGLSISPLSLRVSQVPSVLDERLQVVWYASFCACSGSKERSKGKSGSHLVVYLDPKSVSHERHTLDGIWRCPRCVSRDAHEGLACPGHDRVAGKHLYMEKASLNHPPRKGSCVCSRQ